MQVGGRKLLTRVWVDFELNKCSKFADKSAHGSAMLLWIHTLREHFTLSIGLEIPGVRLVECLLVPFRGGLALGKNINLLQATKRACINKRVDVLLLYKHAIV